MTIAHGVAKELRYKRESTWSVLPATNAAQFLRRVTSDLDLRKDTYQSNEMRKDRQIADFRHGVRSVVGSITGELSPATYADFFRAICRQAFQAAPTTGTIAALVVTSAQPQYTRGSGNYLTEGFKVGDVLRWTGGTAAGTANNNRNFMISSLNGTAMGGFNLDGSDVVAAGTQASMVGTLAGKKTWVPSTGQLDESFAFEHWFSDVSQSERFAGCKLSTMGIALPPTGIATINMGFMGRERTTGTAEYFVTGSASAETTTGLVAAINGVILVGTNQVASITGAGLNLRSGLSMAGPVMGANLYPAIQLGRFMADGQITALFEDGVLRDLFDQETEASVLLAMAVNDSGTADFVSFVAPRVKFGGSSKDDGEKAIVQTLPFQALLNVNGGTAASSQLTTMSVQDSQAP